MSTLSEVPLSVLDLVPVVSGSTATIALNASVDLAQHAERLGYHRYWLAEHHNMRGIAAAAPPVLVGRIAAATEKIRVGSGGVMLPLHPPLVIAEQFGTLEAFYPGRIDLGVVRAAGINPDTTRALSGPGRRSAEQFAQLLDELIGYFDPGKDDVVRATPAAGNSPPLWVLGSGESSAQLAGSLGLPYAFAHHLKARNTESALRAYRESFRPSKALGKPYVILSVSVIAADTDEHAHWVAGPSKLKYLSRRWGDSVMLSTPEQAAAYSYTEDDKAIIEKGFAGRVIGSPDTVHKRLLALVDETHANEVMVTNRIYGHSDRRRSYELVSEIAR